jgi:hypothetical protein
VSKASDDPDTGAHRVPQVFLPRIAFLYALDAREKRRNVLRTATSQLHSLHHREYKYVEWERRGINDASFLLSLEFAN